MQYYHIDILLAYGCVFKVFVVVIGNEDAINMLLPMIFANHHK